MIHNFFNAIIFQSTLPAREATSGLTRWTWTASNFNPRFPRGKRRGRGSNIVKLIKFQSTLPAREATLSFRLKVLRDLFQSTLPAREATEAAFYFDVVHHDFNPRFPRGKRQSGSGDGCYIWRNFNPRFPRGKRLTMAGLKAGATAISIHASREGSDRHSQGQVGAEMLFQSTLPAREATKYPGQPASHWEISIHASREGSDKRLNPVASG